LKERLTFKEITMRPMLALCAALLAGCVADTDTTQQAVEGFGFAPDLCDVVVFDPSNNRNFAERWFDRGPGGTLRATDDPQNPRNNSCEVAGRCQMRLVSADLERYAVSELEAVLAGEPAEVVVDESGREWWMYAWDAEVVMNLCVGRL
jgi:hypothetical protein